MGYWGRINRWNGISKEADAVEILTALARVDGVSGHGEPGLVELLAYSASLSLREFVRLHTQLPYRRSIASYKPHLIHGDETDMSMIKYSANRFARPDAYFCPTCVDSDAVHYGTSYWHRSHQLPGMYVCPTHGDALYVVDSSNAFMQAPAVSLDDCHAIDSAWARENHENRYVQEFLRLSIALSALPHPIPLQNARTVLSERAKALDIPTYPIRSSQYRLSDKILSRYPGNWLELVFPRAWDKNPGEIQHQLDGILYCSTSASSIVVYLLGACVLFDTADEFLQAIAENQGANRPKRASVNRAAYRPIELHEGLASYIRCKGSYKAIASEHGLPLSVIKTQLLAFGLPNLAERGSKQLPNYLLALQCFYLRQMSLAESARVGGLSAAEIERLIRQAGIHLPAALRQIDISVGQG